MSERRDMFILLDPDGSPQWDTVRPTEAECGHARFAKGSHKPTIDAWGYKIVKCTVEVQP